MYYKQTATQLFSTLKELHGQEPEMFDFYCSQYISGERNKQTRKELMKLATGEDFPISKCGMYAVADALKNNFQQLNLF